ncbi:MAG: hypothetical protein Q7S06_03675 [Nanoarchaeota archaeon]|nr:hypothetical protein [Nanoarchaeota archaeon]
MKKILIILAALFLLQICLTSALTIDSVISNPQEVQPGEKFSLNLKIENNLNEEVKDVVISLDLSETFFAPYQSSNEVRIDNINGDDNEKANFDLIASSDAISGTYTIPVTINYDHANGTHATPEEKVVGVIINAKPNIEVSYEGSVLVKGTSGKVTVKIVNSGLGDAKFLSVGLSAINGIQATGSNKIYIGNIDSNDFDSADFSVFVKADSPSSISLPIQLTYSDSRNNQITKEENILIKTYTQKEAIGLGLINKNNTFLIIISIVGVIIIFLVYRRIRKKNRNKRNGQ